MTTDIHIQLWRVAALWKNRTGSWEKISQQVKQKRKICTKVLMDAKIGDSYQFGSQKVRKRKGTSGICITQKEFIYTRNKRLTESTAVVSMETMAETGGTQGHQTKQSQQRREVESALEVQSQASVSFTIRSWGFWIGYQLYSMEQFLQWQYFQNKHSPMPGENVQPRFA